MSEAKHAVSTGYGVGRLAECRRGRRVALAMRHTPTNPCAPRSAPSFGEDSPDNEALAAGRKLQHGTTRCCFQPNHCTHRSGQLDGMGGYPEIHIYRAALPPGHERMANLVNLMVPTINALTRATEFALAFVCLLLNRCC